MLAETNTEYDGERRVAERPAAMLRGMPWIRAVFWSQLPSRGKAQRAGAPASSTGTSSETRRPPPQLRRIIEDGVRWRHESEAATRESAPG